MLMRTRAPRHDVPLAAAPQQRPCSRCRTCDQTLPAASFSKNRNNWTDGLKPDCKACDKKQQGKRRKQQQEKQQEKQQPGRQAELVRERRRSLYIQLPIERLRHSRLPCLAELRGQALHHYPSAA